MSVNVQALNSVIDTQDTKLLESYRSINDIGEKFTDDECVQFASILRNHRDLFDLIGYNFFYLGQVTDRINQEFDVLKSLEEEIISIELKSTISKFGDVQKTLNDIKFYTRTHNKRFIGIAYFADADELYFLDDNKLLPLDLEVLKYLSNEVNHNFLDDISESKFIFSPLTHLDRFKNNDYLLTQPQETIVNNIVQRGLSFGVAGTAGVGKSLALYDAAKKIKKQFPNKKVLIVFSRGSISDLHRRWSKTFEIDIFSAKLGYVDLSIYDVVLVDESQRLLLNTKNQLKEAYQSGLIDQLVLFFDPEKQFFSQYETGERITSLVKDELKLEVITLKHSIRSDKNLVNFVEAIFDLRKKKDIQDYNRIDLQYFSTFEKAQEWICIKEKEGYSALIPMEDTLKKTEIDDFLNGSNGKRLNSYDVIGQDLEKVAVVMDSHYKYNNSNGTLYTVDSDYYYYRHTQLHVNLTRAKEKIAIAVVDNPDLFNGISSIINFHKKSV